ncbi:MAG: hypothetical protein JRD05_00585 [Deltaproteobacteria bacterium]|nr:hypothetical protein [Deltaproteobacteria bacterium]
MNDQQKKCFKLVYDFIHDERVNAANLIALIDIRFPETDSDISKTLHGAVKPYLEMRHRLGAATMDLMYSLKRILANEKEGTDKPAKTESDMPELCPKCTNIGGVLNTLNGPKRL